MILTTLNLQGFIDWEARKPAILEYLRAIDPDIIFFQEVVFIPDVSPYNQAQLLNQELGYTYEQSVITRLQPSPLYQTFREGLAVLSKYPIVTTDTIILKQLPGDEHNRIIQCVDIKKNDVIVKCANIHFSISDTVDYATPHFEETLSFFYSHNEERIIAGDFNLTDLSYSSEIWQDRYTPSSDVPYISFPEENKRIDYILAPKNYSIDSVSTSPDGLSDHRAVTAVISSH